jgi:hypothetical protein
MTTITISADLGVGGIFTCYENGAERRYPTGVEISVPDWVAERVAQQANNGYAVATSVVSGGFKAVARDPAADTVEVKRGTDGRGYVPTYTTPYVLPVASTALGGIKAVARTPETDTVPVKIGTDGKGYVPAYPTEYTLPNATASVKGGVNAAANQADSTESTSPTVTEFNALLAKLKAAGIMLADS